MGKTGGGICFKINRGKKTDDQIYISCSFFPSSKIFPVKEVWAAICLVFLVRGDCPLGVPVVSALIKALIKPGKNGSV